jgi:hypothetical protein
MRVTLQLTPVVHIAYGTDHAVGHFAQVWTTGDHKDGCPCLGCEYDMPDADADNLPGWHGVIDFIRRTTGYDITGHIVGVGPEAMLVDADAYAELLGTEEPLLDAPEDYAYTDGVHTVYRPVV